MGMSLTETQWSELATQFLVLSIYILRNLKNFQLISKKRRDDGEQDLVGLFSIYSDYGGHKFPIRDNGTKNSKVHIWYCQGCTLESHV